MAEVSLVEMLSHWGFSVRIHVKSAMANGAAGAIIGGVHWRRGAPLGAVPAMPLQRSDCSVSDHGPKASDIESSISWHKGSTMKAAGYQVLCPLFKTVILKNVYSFIFQ